MTLQGQQLHPLPQYLHLQCIRNVQGWTLLAYLLRNMSLSKQARKRIFKESWEEKYFCCAQDDNVRGLLCSIVQKGTHKWNTKRHYDTVLCSKSAPDAANLSIFILRHVHWGMRCATSSWGHIEYMIADACSNSTRVICPNHFNIFCSIYSGNGLTQRFSNYGPRTTCGPRDLPLWPLKIQKKN